MLGWKLQFSILFLYGMDALPPLVGLATFAAFQQDHQYSFFLSGIGSNTLRWKLLAQAFAMTNSDNSLIGNHKQYYS